MKVQLKNIVKRFGDNLILDNVSFDFKENAITTIIGESGNGKTTLLNIMALFSDADSGTLIFDKLDISNLSKKQKLKFIRENIGYVYQDIRIFEDATAYDNLKVGLTFSNVPKAEYNEKILEMFKILNLSGKEKTKAGVLSGGEKQRLAIGRALISGKSLILADEPTGALDEKNTLNILELIKKINEELHTTIILITHSQTVAQYFGNNVEITRGKLYEK